jgi:starvation-inducible DNA-binding protein
MKKSKKISNTTTNVIDALAHLLADTYLLYLKTQNFHWNVTGPHFISLHKLFEEQYESLSAATDVLAERIRALNAEAPGSFSDFLKLASLEEACEETSAEDMVASLLKDHEAMSAAIKDMFAITQEDEVTMDILIERKTEHDKIIWMLRSTMSR